MVEKSFDLRVADCKQDLVNILNTSGLPISVLALIVREINETVATQHTFAVERAREEYEKALANVPEVPEVIMEEVK